MKVFCENTKTTYAVREHTNNKMPSYCSKADPIAIKQNGNDGSCWVRPNKPDSERVNFLVEGKWVFVDNATLKGQIVGGKATNFVFVTNKEQLEALVAPKPAEGSQPQAQATKSAQNPVQNAGKAAAAPVKPATQAAPATK